MRRPRIQLAQVTDRTGRLDVAAYRIAERMLQNLEKTRGINGLCREFLPIVEAAITDTLPGRNLVNDIPPELQAIMHVFMENRRLL